MKKRILLAIVTLQAMFASAQNTICAVDSDNEFTTQSDIILRQNHLEHGHDICFGISPCRSDAPDLPIRIHRNLPAQVQASPETMNSGVHKVSQPEGSLTTYGRAGRCYYMLDGTMMNNVQSGMVDIIENGNKVYFKGIVSGIPFENNWIEGTRSGNTITVAVGQDLAFDSDRGCNIKLYMMKATAGSGLFEIDSSVSAISFTVSGERISLNHSDADNIISGAFADNRSWIGVGDYESVYTPFVDAVVVAPDDLETTPFNIVGITDRSTSIRASVVMGFHNSDVYIKGLCYEFLPNAWIKGRKVGNEILIPSGQYLGLYENAYNFYLVGVDPAGQDIVDDLIFVYDEVNDIYVSENFLLFNAYKDKIGYYSYLVNVSMSETRNFPFTTDVISAQPEGNLKTYSRNGVGVHAFGGSVYVSSQQGRILEMVYAPDGTTVYMKDPISRAVASSNWVKGTLAGNTITMPLYQCVAYYEEDGIGLITAKMVKHTGTDPDTGQSYSTYGVDFDATEITFTVNADGTISLDGTQEGDVAYGLIYTDDFTWTGALDYESVYIPFDDTAEEIPIGIESLPWSYRYTDTQGNAKSAVVSVATQGDNFYIQGLLHTSPHTSIVGTIDGTKVTFDSNQFMGMNQNVLVYFSGATFTRQQQADGANGTPSYTYEFTPTDQLVFDYDASAHTLKAANNVALLFNSGKTTEGLYYSQADVNPELGYFVESTATPADPEIVEFFNGMFDDIGYSQLKLNIRTEDTQGNFINPEQLSYQLFVKRGGNIEPYTLTTSNYMFLDHDMDVIPYSFTDNFDIMVGGKSIRIYENDFDDIAVRVTSNSDNESIYSNRVWAATGVESGSSAIQPVCDNGKEIKSITYHSIHGILVTNPQSGLYIKTVTYTDGSHDTFKVVKQDNIE